MIATVKKERTMIASLRRFQSSKVSAVARDGSGRCDRCVLWHELRRYLPLRIWAVIVFLCVFENTIF
jgi:hypothetical protein